MSQLFWKLFGVYAVLSLLAVAVLVLFVSRRHEQELNQQIEQRLADMSVLLDDQMDQVLPLAAGDLLKIQNLANRLARQIDARITIVALDGEVLADSDEDPARMLNHAHRAEIEAAIANKGGTSRRISPTLSIPMLYHARRVDRAGQPVMTVRLAYPLESVQRQVAAGRDVIVAVTLGVCGTALLLTYGLVGWILRPIERLTRAAEAISAGDFKFEVHVPGQNEFNALAQAFRKMSRELDLRVTQIGRDSERLGTVLGCMVEGVVAVDDQSRVLLANRAARDLFEINTPQPEGRPLVEVVRHAAVSQTVHSALADPSPQHSEFEFLGESRRRLELHVSRLPGEPCPGLVLVVRDVTELRRLEGLRQEFAANVSHELKTPLAAIKACSETLLEGAIDDREHCLSFIRKIEHHANRLEQLILDLLSLARIEAGQQPFSIEVVRLDDHLLEWSGEHAAAAEAKGIRLTTSPPPAPVRVQVDVEGLRQIFDNLLDNAIKYTPEGGSVSIAWRQEGSLGVLEVADTGIGIAPAHQQRIFERFYRVDKARSRKVGGTGLGLSIVKHLAKTFGGSVAVRSKPGEGSTFIVTLPVV